MGNAAGVAGLVAQIGELREGLESLKEDVKGIDPRSGMMRTFEAGEAAALKGKLARAEERLAASRKSKDAEEAAWQAERAARVLNDVAATLALEAAEFRAEMIAFRSRLRREAELARYERSVERAHEGFLAVAKILGGIVAAVAKIL